MLALAALVALSFGVAVVIATALFVWSGGPTHAWSPSRLTRLVSASAAGVGVFGLATCLALAWSPFARGPLQYAATGGSGAIFVFWFRFAMFLPGAPVFQITPVAQLFVLVAEAFGGERRSLAAAAAAAALAAAGAVAWIATIHLWAPTA